MESSYTLLKKAKELERKHQYQEAADTYLKAANINLKDEKKGFAAFKFSEAGICLKNIGKIDEALKLFKQALEIDEELGDRKGKTIRLNNIGSILQDRGEWDEALK